MNHRSRREAAGKTAASTFGRDTIFRHLAIGTNDPEAARRFYDATFAALGIAAGKQDEKGRILYRHDGALLIVGRPIDGQPATHANGGTIGFSAPSDQSILAWHHAGLANGGTECEGQPVKRVSPATGRTVHVAYLRDPAGNKLCAVYDAPE